MSVSATVASGEHPSRGPTAEPPVDTRSAAETAAAATAVILRIPVRSATAPRSAALTGVGLAAMAAGRHPAV